jgi:hypothetical protein
MARHEIYFGTRDRMRMVPCPAINAGISAEGWGESGTYLGGGGYVKNSRGAHMVYDFAWNTASRQEIYSVVDYASGAYGDGLIYFLDPFTEDANVLPERWSAPGNIDAHGRSLLTTGAMPTVSTTGANTIGLPVRQAAYTVANNGRELWIPVPPGHSFYFGWHGTVTSSGAVQVNGTARAPQAVNATTLTNHVISPVNGGVTIRLWGVGAVTIAGMMGQVLPTGSSAPTGEWILGRGNSGCRFQGRPKVSGLSAALDKVSARATLVETGDWE